MSEITPGTICVVVRMPPALADLNGRVLTAISGAMGGLWQAPDGSVGDGVAHMCEATWLGRRWVQRRNLMPISEPDQIEVVEAADTVFG
ncbi:MAG: hypothetical protein AB7P21_07660 [Lautropia sp.]